MSERQSEYGNESIRVEESRLESMGPKDDRFQYGNLCRSAPSIPVVLTN
jgi:hypothetical protein